MPMTYDPQKEDLNTVFEQFALSLPGDMSYQDVHAVAVNHYKLDEAISYNQIYAMLDAMDSNMVLYGDFLKHPDKLYLATKELSKRKLNNLFHHHVWQSYAIDNSFYYLSQDDENKNEDKATNDSENKQSKAEKPLIEITDFKELQKRALKLEAKYQEVKSGQKAVRDSMRNNSFDNFKLQDKLQKHIELKQSDQKMLMYLKQLYPQGFTNLFSRLQLIDYLLNNWSRADVQQVTLGKPNNLMHIIEIIAHEDT